MPRRQPRRRATHPLRTPPARSSDAPQLRDQLVVGMPVGGLDLPPPDRHAELRPRDLVLRGLAESGHESASIVRCCSGECLAHGRDSDMSRHLCQPTSVLSDSIARHTERQSRRGRSRPASRPACDRLNGPRCALQHCLFAPPDPRVPSLFEPTASITGAHFLMSSVNASSPREKDARPWQYFRPVPEN